MVSRKQIVTGQALGLLVLALACGAALELSEDFYAKSCPNVTSIVRDLVREAVEEDAGVAAGILRLHFHDCFVDGDSVASIFNLGGLQGCDASVLLDPTSSSIECEKDSPPNANSLRAFEEIDEIKAVLEEECPGIVSCADILALASRDAVEETGGPSWPVPLGRRDGYISSSLEAQRKLPPSDGTFDELSANFAMVGLDPIDMIILSGGHTLGRGRCVKVWDRLYNFSGVPDQTDPGLDPAYAEELKAKCPKDGSGSFLMMDSTDATFDNVYYQDVQGNRGLFESDAALLGSPVGSNLVKKLAVNQTSFFEMFGAAMVRMGKIDLKLGTQGEVRRQCWVSNPSRHPRRSSS